ncbi:MAG: type 4a pilus biogenesis protein PilO [Candidatus Eremiobacterota bacterium]
MTAGMKIAVFFCLVILIGIGFYLFVYQPKQQELDALEKGPGGIVELTNQRDADKAYVQNMDQYEKQLQDAQKELANLQVDVEGGEDFIPSYLESIEKLVAEVRGNLQDWDFVILSITPGNATAGQAGEGGGSVYNTYLMQMNVEGQYDTLRTFLNTLSDKSRFNKLVVVNSISLTPKKNKAGYQTLNITIPLMAYQFTKGGVQQ